eukprot:2543397-Amphidinium_carterae.1
MDVFIKSALKLCKTAAELFTIPGKPKDDWGDGDGRWWLRPWTPRQPKLVASAPRTPQTPRMICSMR